MMYLSNINEEGRRTFCGPAALMLVTGADLDAVRRKVNRLRKRPPRHRVMGMYNTEMTVLLKRFGVKAIRKKIADRGKGPTVKAFADDYEFVARQKPILINTTSHYVVLYQGVVYDNWEKSGKLVADHPYAKARVKGCWFIETKK